MAYPTTANNLLTAASDGTSTIDPVYDHGLNHNAANADTNALTQRLGTGSDTTPGGTNKVFTSTGATSSAWSGDPTVTSVTTVGAATVGNALTVQAGGAAITGAVGITGAETVTSSSSAALAVGPAGASNPVLQIDGSTASQVNGIKATGSVAGQPPVITTIGTDTDVSLRLAPKGAGGVRVLSTAADAFDVGPNGATNPVLKVDGSVVSQADGISVQGGAAGTGTIISAISSGSNSSIVLTPKGSGGVQQTVGNLSLAQNPAAGAATSIASSGTIASSNSVQRVTSAADVTGVIVAVGTVAGQQLEILNTGANKITMAASGTSNVSGGVTNIITTGAGLTLVWSSVEALWFPTGGGSAGNTLSAVEQEFANASGTTVTLSQANISGVALVARNGVVQRQGVDYTVNASTGVITFTTTLVSEQVSVAFWAGGNATGNATTLNGFTTSTSKAANAIPVSDASGHIPVGMSYGLRTRTIILNGTTSYTYPVNTQAILVQATGAGGGSGAAAAAAAGHSISSGPGGGGSYSESFITGLPASPVTVAVGAGGSAGASGANNGGGNGGNTTFNTSTVVANGGSAGGGGSDVSAYPATSNNPTAAAAAGTGDIALPGSASTMSLWGAINQPVLATSGGGAGPYGGPQTPTPFSGQQHAGTTGANYGAGAGVAYSFNGGTSVAGAAGANGIMVISEFY